MTSINLNIDRYLNRHNVILDGGVSEIENFLSHASAGSVNEHLNRGKKYYGLYFVCFFFWKNITSNKKLRCRASKMTIY